jgi:hypothetical protein
MPMHDTQVSDDDFRAAARYVNGDADDEAEDAYYEVERIALSVDLLNGLLILKRLASGVDQRRLNDFGAGFLETFLAARGAENPDLIEDAIKGDRRLIQALRGINSFAIPFDLALRLSPLV